MGYITIREEQFYLDQHPIRFRGLGVGSWLNMEHFMLGIPTPDKQIREAFAEVFGEERSRDFFQSFMENFCEEKDFIFLKEIGVNLLRVPFNYRLFLDDKHAGVYKEEGFRYLDRLMELCRKYEIYLLPDLHTAPGGQNPDWHSDNQTGSPQFWHYELYQNQIVKLWETIAARYCEEPYLLGYDVLNEPFLIPAEHGRIQHFYDKVTEGIRRVDSNHIIFLEGDFFSMDFSAIHHIKDEQTALTFHFYPGVWDPALCKADYPGEQRRRVFEEQFEKLTGQMKQFKRPILCGEAGYEIAGHSLSHVMELVKDTLDLFEKHGVSWTLWCYKDAGFMGIVYPGKDSLWMQFAEEIREQWTHYGEMNMGKEIVEFMCVYFPGEVSEELKYHLQFRQRSLLYTLQKEQILKPQLKRWGWERISRMPDSFRMENCGYYKPYRKLLEQYTRQTLTIDI